MSKKETIDFFCEKKSMSIDNLYTKWTYYEPVAKCSLFVKVFVLKMNNVKNKECNAIANYLKKLDIFLSPYAHVFGNGAFMKDVLDFFIGLNANITLKTLKTSVIAYLQNKPNFREITINNLRYDVNKTVVLDVFKDLTHDKYDDVKWNIEHIYPQTYSKKLSSDKLLHCLGNLTLLRRCKNSSVGNMQPEKKFVSDVYKNSGFKLNEELMNMTYWTEKDIEDRHNRLVNKWFDMFFGKTINLFDILLHNDINILL